MLHCQYMKLADKKRKKEKKKENELKHNPCCYFWAASTYSFAVHRCRKNAILNGPVNYVTLSRHETCW